MTITVSKIGEGYMAKVTPPHGNGSNWESHTPLTSAQLIQKLLALGCHQTDIGDAFYEADPEWLKS
jgi:hypothetical protein